MRKSLKTRGPILGSIPSLPSVPYIPPAPEPVQDAHDFVESWAQLQLLQQPDEWTDQYDSSIMLRGPMDKPFDMLDSSYSPAAFSPTHPHESLNDYCSQNPPTQSPTAPFNYSQSSSLRAALTALPTVSPISPSPYLPTPTPSAVMELPHPTPHPSAHTSPAAHPAPPLPMQLPTPVAGPSRLPEDPASGSSNHNLASLGSTIISVPVPFPDSPQEPHRTVGASATASTATALPEEPAAAVQVQQHEASSSSYPTPESSPAVADAASLVATTSVHIPGRDPGRHYRTDADKRKASAKPYARKKPREPGPPPKLSSNLPVSSSHE